MIGPKVCIYGPAGTGKTTSLRTLKPYVEAGKVEVFPLFLDANYTVLGKDLEWMHWAYMAPASPSLKDLTESANFINKLSPSALQDLKGGIGKGSYREWLDMLGLLADWRDHLGKGWGPVDSWSHKRILVIDPLTGLNKMSRNLTVGAKPVITQPEWGTMMDNLGRLIDLLTGIDCGFILLAHVDREVDEVLGGSRKTLLTLGKKLAPTMLPSFNDIILSVREGDKFYWDTIDSQAELKAINLSLRAKQDPNFGALLANWEARGGQF